MSSAHTRQQSAAVCVMVCTKITDAYRKRGKICWAKLSHFSWFSGVLRKFFREYKCLSLITLNNESTYALLMAKVTQKYFRKSFDGTETANI